MSQSSNKRTPIGTYHLLTSHIMGKKLSFFFLFISFLLFSYRRNAFYHYFAPNICFGIFLVSIWKIGFQTRGTNWATNHQLEEQRANTWTSARWKSIIRMQMMNFLIKGGEPPGSKIISVLKVHNLTTNLSSAWTCKTEAKIISNYKRRNHINHVSCAVNSSLACFMKSHNVGIIWEVVDFLF